MDSFIWFIAGPLLYIAVITFVVVTGKKVLYLFNNVFVGCFDSDFSCANEPRAVHKIMRTSQGDLVPARQCKKHKLRM